MKTFKIEIPYSYKEYFADNRFKIKTEEDIEVYIMDKNWKIDQYTFGTIGFFTKDNKDFVLVFDDDGNVSFCSDGKEHTLKLVRFESYYDTITKMDVPDTPEFQKRFESFNNNFLKLNPIEYLRYKTFQEDHIHGSVSLSFSNGGGIGTNISCKCGTCGQEVNISDIDSW